MTTYSHDLVLTVRCQPFGRTGGGGCRACTQGKCQPREGAVGGRDGDGVLTGFNLTENQSTDADRYNENCLWLGGKKSQLGAVTFDREDVGSDSEVWHVRDHEGRVNVDFRLAQNDDVRINALVLESRYRGPYGRFSGHIVDDEDNAIDVSCCLGMGEDFYLRT